MRYSSLLNFLLVIFSQTSGSFLTDIFSFFFHILRNDAWSAVFATTGLIANLIFWLEAARKTQKKKKLKKKKKKVPIKITVDIDGKPISIESPNAENMNNLLQRFKVLDPKTDGATLPSPIVENRDQAARKTTTMKTPIRKRRKRRRKY